MSELVLDSLEIKNYRAFKHLRVEKLGRVNLIVGNNNVGKTSLLNALWRITGEGDEAEPETCRCCFIRGPGQGLPAVFIPSGGLDRAQSAQLWEAIASSSDLASDVLAFVRMVAPEAGRIGIAFSERSHFYIETGPLAHSVPLGSYGNGMGRVFNIALALVNAQDGVLLIDEVDTGLHYSVLPDFWSLVIETANRLNVQVFATTHGWECVQALQQAAEENKEGRAIAVRLEARKAGVHAVVFDERELAIVTREKIEIR